MVQRLSLTRDQLASFLSDFEQIKQFEALFSTVDVMVNGGDNVEIIGGNAGAGANQALGLVQRLADSTAATDAAIGAKASLALALIAGLQNAAQFSSTAPARIVPPPASALTIATAGTDITSTVADPTTRPVVTLNVPTASAAKRGALSSVDWVTFNGKQPNVGSVQVQWSQAVGGATTFTNMGLGAGTVVGTATARTPVTTSFFLSRSRLGYVSAAGAGSSAGWRYGVTGAGVVRGNAAGIGGFTHTETFGVNQSVAGCRLFAGLWVAGGAVGNVDPSTLLNMVGIGLDAADTNLQIMHNDGAGAATKVDLGASFPGRTNAVDLYKLELSCIPNGSDITYTVTRLNTGATTTGTLSTNLPVNTVYISQTLHINNGATAAVCSIDHVNRLTVSNLA